MFHTTKSKRELAENEITVNLFFFTIAVIIFMIFLIVPQILGGQNQSAFFFVVGVYIYIGFVIYVLYHYGKTNREKSINL